MAWQGASDGRKVDAVERIHGPDGDAGLLREQRRQPVVLRLAADQQRLLRPRAPKGHAVVPQTQPDLPAKLAQRRAKAFEDRALDSD